MIRLRDIKMKPKLILLFLLVGLIPLCTVGYWSYRQSEKALMEQSFNQMKAVQGIKKTQIQTYLEERKGDISVLAETVAGFGGNKTLHNWTEEQRKFFVKYKEMYGYYDLFLIEPTAISIIPYAKNPIIRLIFSTANMPTAIWES